MHLLKQLAVSLLLPAFVGVATGACVAGLVGGFERWGLHGLATLPGMLPALFIIPGLLLTGLIRRYLVRVSEPRTSELYISLVHQPGSRLPIEQVPGRVLATAATVGLGGAQGFESTSALIGATWGNVPGRWLSPDARQSLLAAGASAGIAAVFSSPAAGALYGIEVPFKNRIDGAKLVPCVVAAVASFTTRVALIGEDRIVNVTGMPTLDGLFVIGMLLTAIGCGLGARLFAVVERGLQSAGRRHGMLTRSLAGGALIAAVAWAGFSLTGRWITFGSGYTATSWLESAPHSVGTLLLALAIRAGANLLTVYGGGGGGVFTSLAANGAFVGAIVGTALGVDSVHTLALFGAACFLGAGYRIPLACMLFIAEALLGPMAIGLGMIAVAISFAMMGDETVSEAQRD